MHKWSVETQTEEAVEVMMLRLDESWRVRSGRTWMVEAKKQIELQFNMIEQEKLQEYQFYRYQ